MRPVQDIPWTIGSRVKLDSDDEMDLNDTISPLDVNDYNRASGKSPSDAERGEGGLLEGVPLRPLHDIPWTIGSRVKLDSDDEMELNDTISPLDVNDYVRALGKPPSDAEREEGALSEETP